MADNQRSAEVSPVQRQANQRVPNAAGLASGSAANPPAARLGYAPPAATEMHAAQVLPQDFDAVIGVLAGPANAWLTPAASRLQPLTAAALAALNSSAELQLAELVQKLRLQYAALSDRATADRAVHAAIDLPQSMRMDVHATRGKAPPELAA